MRTLLMALAFPALLPAADANIWRTAPAPPASWQRDRVSDLTNRRKAAMERIGEKGMLLVYAGEPRVYSGDVDYPFRQENNFFYLTGITQPGGTLVLADKREILFMPPSNRARENVTGHMLTPDESRQISGVQEIQDASALPAFLATLIPRARAVLMPNAPPTFGRGGAPPESSMLDAVYTILPARPQSREYGREQEFAAKLASIGLGIAIKDATPIFGALRRVKSQREIDILQHAVDITAEAFQRVYAVTAPGMWEYEIQAQFEYTFFRRNSHWGYPCIVASGNNATVLHYESNQSRMSDGDLLLMDDAAEFDGYSVDVTRTIPVNGKFTKQQAEIYRLVWEAQQAGIRMARPGHASSGPADSIQGAANQVFKEGLMKLGLITEATDQQVRIWFVHGISHGIGLNVHDPGGRELQPGMTVTVEPGLYIRPDALDSLPKTPENEKFIAAVRPAFEKYKGIGVRIEDDVLVTSGEPKILSAAIPSKLEDVEAAMAHLKQSIKTMP